MTDDTFTLPPFELQPLIEKVVDQGNFQPGSHDSHRIVTCARTLDTEIFVGCQDGSLMRYILPELDGGLAEAYMLLFRADTPEQKPVDDIQLVTASGRILVLSDHRVYSYTYPNLDYISSEPSLKNAISICLDENPPTPSTRVGQLPTTEFCVIKASAVTLYALREKIQYRKEIPLPKEMQQPQLAKRVGNSLCLADATNYNMIDLHGATLNPLIPISQTLDAPIAQPVIQVDENSDFMVLSWTGNSTLGIFLNGSGDPTGRLIEYPTQVSSLSIGSLNVVALLSNGTMQIHDLATQNLTQEFPASAYVSMPDSLISNRVGTLIPSIQRRQRLQLMDYQLPALEPEEGGIPAISSKSRTKPHRPTFTRSRVTLQCNNAVHALTIRSRISQAEELIDFHRLKECEALLGKRPVSTSGASDPDEAEELRYLQLRLGYQYFTNTSFEDAGTWLFRGQLDPRILISHFPDLTGFLLDPRTTYEVFLGLQDHIPRSSVEDVIANYSPHLSPNTREAPSTAELRKIKREQARVMLLEYLRKWRTKRAYEDRRHVNEELDQAVDTVFLRLLAERGRTEDILSMLNEPNTISWQDAEGDLIRYGQYCALDKLYEQNGLDRRRVEILAKIVEGKYTEPFLADPLDVVFSIVTKSNDRELLLKWQFWLYERNPERCIELLISKDPNPKQSSKPQDRTLLAQLRKANPNASTTFLEHLVLKKRDKDVELHNSLAEESLKKACSLLQDLRLLDLVLSSRETLKLQHQTKSYLPSWIAALPSTYRVARLKVLLFLQASPYYQADRVLDFLEKLPRSDLCTLEKVLLYGRLGDHTNALALLWRELGDSSAAELYCAQGGDVLYPNILEVASSTADQEPSLSPWLSFYQSRRRKNGIGLIPGSLNQARLVSQLLDVYLHSETRSETHASRLLKSQAKNIELENVLQSIPPDWPLTSFETFIAHKFRDLESQTREVEIVKSLCNGQNLRISEEAHIRLRAEGFVIEEPDSDIDSPTGRVEEKAFYLTEKVDSQTIENENKTENIIA